MHKLQIDACVPLGEARFCCQAISALVGGCRPVGLTPLLAGAGWRVKSEEIILQGGFRSVVILAEAQGTTAEGA
jgi:hypothetical protein